MQVQEYMHVNTYTRVRNAWSQTFWFFQVSCSLSKPILSGSCKTLAMQNAGLKVNDESALSLTKLITGLVVLFYVTHVSEEAGECEDQ